MFGWKDSYIGFHAPAFSLPMSFSSCPLCSTRMANFIAEWRGYFGLFIKLDLLLSPISKVALDSWGFSLWQLKSHIKSVPFGSLLGFWQVDSQNPPKPNRWDSSVDRWCGCGSVKMQRTERDFPLCILYDSARIIDVAVRMHLSTGNWFFQTSNLDYNPMTVNVSNSDLNSSAPQSNVTPGLKTSLLSMLNYVQLKLST